MSVDPVSLHIEKILERLLDRGLKDVRLIGTDSTLALSFFLSQMTSPRVWETPQLVIVPTDADANRFEKDVCFFDDELHVSVLPPFDVSPYSSLYPNARNISARVRWAAEAQTPRSRHLFVASIEALMQQTLPVACLQRHRRKFKVGDELPAEVARYLSKVGYQSVPVVEDEGTFAIRGGIVDIYSAFHDYPVRVELFGDTIDSLRFFHPETQRSLESIKDFTLISPREIVYDDEAKERALTRFRGSAVTREVDESDRDMIAQSLLQGQIFPGLDFMLGDFYETSTSPLDHFAEAVTAWFVNPIEISRVADHLIATLSKESAETNQHAIHPEIADLYRILPEIDPGSSIGNSKHFARRFELSQIDVSDSPLDDAADRTVRLQISDLRFSAPAGAPDTTADAIPKLQAWRESGLAAFIAVSSTAQAQRLQLLLERANFTSQLTNEKDFKWGDWVEEQRQSPALVHIIPRVLDESLRMSEEGLVFLRDEDFFGKKSRKKEYKKTGTLAARTNTTLITDLKPGDAVVHVQHGIGIYEGLKVMEIQAVANEYIQLSYKDGDKLYLPVYRINQIQKYSGPAGNKILDKLGGAQWAKVTGKVRNRLRELALDLLELYAKRSQITRPPFPSNDDDFERFEGSFPYDETEDQLKAVSDIVKDMSSDRPMDRLVCGDVGFGKTEVAMRAAFKAVEGQKQVAVLAPTTVLTFQHLETFTKRFKNWPVVIRALNRFVPTADAKKTMAELKEGKVDIVIGTHRLLGKGIDFKDLGLMIVDEEQKFGVAHKEKIRKMKSAVDTLAMSATPIPRTLNMSLVGMRDLSIINTAPVDRLPTRTFVTKFDAETIRKAITAEIQRGGQVFFLHNRVQSIYSTADEIRQIVPEARIKIGHGQMQEHELEATMISFFNHEIDVLVCTTIIESGIDNPRANTMFIDNAQQFGLSQLYQLRGRVGRSKERAYCYLLIPPNRRIEADAQERLKIIQENTALGSGIRIAHHDLELRGAGNILGEDQSGDIDSVGYEMYLELLEEAVSNAKGEAPTPNIEPDINVRIPALIPDQYIPDLRIRLSYYRALTDITSPEDIDRIEDELKDQFGKLPEQVVNLMGLMLIRHHCRELGIRDLSSGPKTIALSFTEHTPLPAQKVVELAMRDNKKYSITPDNRLIVRMNTIAWPTIYEELLYLKRLC